MKENIKPKNNRKGNLEEQQHDSLRSFASSVPITTHSVKLTLLTNTKVHIEKTGF